MVAPEHLLPVFPWGGADSVDDLDASRIVALAHKCLQYYLSLHSIVFCVLPFFSPGSFVLNTAILAYSRAQLLETIIVSRRQI